MQDYAIGEFLRRIGDTVKEARKTHSKIPSVFRHPIRLMSRIQRAESRRRRSQKQLDAPVPRFCIFSVTWNCNLRCAGCYAKDYPRDARQALSLDDISRTLDDACRLGMFLFVIVGGEPLLVPGLVDLLATKTDGLFLLFTNGTLIDPRFADSVARATNIIPILSMEGDAQLTDDRRGPGVGHSVLAAAELLARSHIAFGSAAMATHKNVTTITSRAWFDQMWDAGSRFIFLIDYVPFPSSFDPALVLTPDDKERKATAIEQRKKEGRPLVMNFPPDEYGPLGCLAAGRGFIHINADGWVEPCPFSHHAVDNIRDKPLHDILASGFFAVLRSRFSGRPNPNDECMLFAHSAEVESIVAEHHGRRTDAPSA